MILGWLMQKPSQTSVTVMFLIGRGSSSWFNEKHGLSLTAGDTALPNGADNSGSGYTLTFTPTGYSEQTATISNLDTDDRYGFRRFEITGLSAGDTVAFNASVDTGQNYNPTVSGLLKTLPRGTVRKGYGSCLAVHDNTDYWADSDYGTFMPTARHLVNELDIHYFTLMDDFVYMGLGSQSSWTNPIRFSPPKNVSTDTARLVGSTDTSATTSDSWLYMDFDRTASDSLSVVQHRMVVSFLNPAVQYIGQHCPFVATAGDHDFAPFNDWDHSLDWGGSAANSVATWKAGYDLWHKLFGLEAYPTGTIYESSAPTTAVYPDLLLPTPPTDPVVDPVNYYPSHFSIDTDYVCDFHPDFLTHRSELEDDSVGSTLLGATQLSDFMLALTSCNKGEVNERPFVTVSSQKQFMATMVNNADGYTGNSQYTVRGASASQERNTFISHMKTLDKAVSVFSGDAHGLNDAFDENIFEWNVAGISTEGAYPSSTGQYTSSTSVSVDDLYAGTEFATGLSGQWGGGQYDGVGTDQTASTLLPLEGYRCGFGYSEFRKDGATHAMLDSRGYPVGSFVSFAPYTLNFNAEPLNLSTTVVRAVEKFDFTARPVIKDEDYFGMGLSHTVTEITTTDNLMEMGVLDGGTKFAAVKGIYLTNSNKSGGMCVTLDTALTEGVTDTGNINTADEWPDGLVITVSKEDGSLPVEFSLASLPSTTGNASEGFVSRRWVLNGTSFGETSATNVPELFGMIFKATTGSTTTVTEAAAGTFAGQDFTGCTLVNANKSETAVIVSNTDDAITHGAMTAASSNDRFIIARDNTSTALKVAVDFESSAAGGAGEQSIISNRIIKH